MIINCFIPILSSVHVVLHYVGQLTLSIQLIKPDYLVIFSTDAASQFLEKIAPFIQSKPLPLRSSKHIKTKFLRQWNCWLWTSYLNFLFIIIFLFMFGNAGQNSFNWPLRGRQINQSQHRTYLYIQFSMQHERVEQRISIWL